MKAFTIFPPETIYFRKLLRKLEDYGVPNFDDIEVFIALYQEWHTKTFPGSQITLMSATFKDDWFNEFVDFLANKEI